MTLTRPRASRIAASARVGSRLACHAPHPLTIGSLRQSRARLGTVRPLAAAETGDGQLHRQAVYSGSTCATVRYYPHLL